MICLYKITRNIKHKEHGWLIVGRHVACRPEYAKRYVIRNEMVRCIVNFSQKDIDRALWIDSEPKEKFVKKEKPVKNPPDGQKAKVTIHRKKRDKQ